MNRTTPLLTLAALAFAGPALAADIDEVATFDLSAAAAPDKADADGAVAQRHGSGATKSRTRTRTTAHGTVQQVQRTNGTKTATGTRTVRTTPSSGSIHGQNGNWVHADGTKTTVHNQVAVTNANGRTATREWGNQQRTGTVQGVRNGERFQGTMTQGRTGVRGTGPNGNTVVNKTNGAQFHGTVGGRPVNAQVHGRPTPGPVRPGATVLHGTTTHVGGGTVVHSVRPGAPVRGPTVVHPVVHGRPVAVRTVTYRRVYPYHGVFVYGPRPTAHVRYVHGGGQPVAVQQQDLPSRAIDRDNTLALGIKGGSMISSTPNQEIYGDPGLGLVGRYRPAEPIALELDLQRHVSAFTPEVGRSNTQLSGSVDLFAFPWARVSPYVLGGVTWNALNLGGDDIGRVGVDGGSAVDGQWGLHGGLGLELAMGNNFALDLEGRYVGWLDERGPTDAPGALQATAGLLYHFK